MDNLHFFRCANEFLMPIWNRHYIENVLRAGTTVHEYEPHTWGPTEVDKLVTPASGWRNPTQSGMECGGPKTSETK